MRSLPKVTRIITLLAIALTISYLPIRAQNTAPVPTTFEILSPSDSSAPFLINHNYAGTNPNRAIFYGGDFANSALDEERERGFRGWLDAGSDGVSCRLVKK